MFYRQKEDEKKNDGGVSREREATAAYASHGKIECNVKLWLLYISSRSIRLKTVGGKAVD